jgi:hypothetical protein
MAERIRQSGSVPPPGEAIHLPGPSYLPVIVALGTTIAIVGVVLSWFLVAAGLLIVLVALVRWIGDTRRDISDLPLEHRS